jgi:adenine-specific DNA glycosylase
MSKWAGKAAAIEEATVWNPRKGPLCRFCPVSSDVCEFKE